MTVLLRRARLRRLPLGALAVACAATLAPIAASAQFFEDAPLSRREIVHVLRDHGFVRIGPPRRAGDVYVVEGIDRGGYRVRLVVDAYAGDILDGVPLGPPRPLARVLPPDEPFSAPPAALPRRRLTARLPDAEASPALPRAVPEPPPRPRDLTIAPDDPETRGPATAATAPAAAPAAGPEPVHAPPVPAAPSGPAHDGGGPGTQRAPESAATAAIQPPAVPEVPPPELVIREKVKPAVPAAPPAGEGASAVPLPAPSD
ncbi:hypothetical protein QNA08_08705 [Chelatococcus sp. SYSU_G07232]|uniref:PepSY domain-containing protein n=1 Tax=Chelatococcus albus TaxID=3047466 RepID=A0ABT7AG19_9HYPH|nr:hypothetical protein [Chelatococcus sp. SYSU_G07232]MDJ1158310.1 hypothetical protein [Chelatococcus sp. SYSU_G07232]